MPGVKRILRVFLCHASGDKAAVYKLYERLTQDGIDAWLDQEKLLPGQNWQIEIPKAVRNSDVVIVCLSGNSVNKEGYVQKEIRFALDFADEKPDGTIFIIPARLESCNVPDRLSQYHWVDLFADGGYEKLLKALQIRAGDVGATIGRRKPASRESAGMVSAQPVSKKKSEPEIKTPERDVKPTESEPAREISVQAKSELIAQPEFLQKFAPVVEQPKPEIKSDAPAPVNKQVLPDLKPEQAAKKPYKLILGSLAGLLVAGFIFFALLNFISKLGGNPTSSEATATEFAMITDTPKPIETSRPVASQAPTKTPVIPTATKADTQKSQKDGMELLYVPASSALSRVADSMIDVKAFWIDKTPITNEMFQKFISETNYQTEPEVNKIGSYCINGTCKLISGDNWTLHNETSNAPVVQISWNDANTYCQWAGRELLSDAEWWSAFIAEKDGSVKVASSFSDYSGVNGEWLSDKTHGLYRAVAGSWGYFSTNSAKVEMPENRSASNLTFRCKIYNP